jgi:uncharacterized SAM-dependent methyltransferase
MYVEATSDARLRDAAGDMLAALRAAEPILALASNRKALATVRAAIAKATGGTAS